MKQFKELLNFVKDSKDVFKDGNYLYIKSIYDNYEVIDILDISTYGKQGYNGLYSHSKVYYIKSKLYSNNDIEGVNKLDDALFDLNDKYNAIRIKSLLSLNDDDLLTMYNNNLYEDEQPYRSMLDNEYIKRDYDYMIDSVELTAKEIYITNINKLDNIHVKSCNFNVLDMCYSEDDLELKAKYLYNLSKYDKRDLIKYLYLRNKESVLVNEYLNNTEFTKKYQRHKDIYYNLTQLEQYINDNNIKSFNLTFTDGNILKIIDLWRIHNIKHTLMNNLKTTDTIHKKEFTTINETKLAYNYVGIDILELSTATFRNKVIMEF